MLESSTYLEEVRRGSQFIYEAASSNLPGSLDVKIHACPGWDMAQLCSHQGNVYRYASAHLAQKAKDPIPRDIIPESPDGGEELLAWYKESESQILEALENADPAEEIWSWTAERTAGFWFRRMAHETLIHAWDAGQAQKQESGGTEYEFDSTLGADGADEYLSTLLPVRFSFMKEHPVPSGTLHLHRTDSADENELGEWFCEIQKNEEGVEEAEITYRHSKGDAAIQASGKNLMLFLWGRISLDSEEIILHGERSVAEQWMVYRP